MKLLSEGIKRHMGQHFYHMISNGVFHDFGSTIEGYLFETYTMNNLFSIGKKAI